jgi:hypothetical protein
MRMQFVAQENTYFLRLDQVGQVKHRSRQSPRIPQSSGAKLYHLRALLPTKLRQWTSPVAEGDHQRRKASSIEVFQEAQKIPLHPANLCLTLNNEDPKRLA